MVSRPGNGVSTVTGSVVDAADVSQGIADAYVYVPIRAVPRTRQASAAPVAEAHTSADGTYTLTGVPEGTQSIVVEPPAGSGYAGMQIDLGIPGGTTVSLRITLARLNADIKGITVVPSEELTLTYGGVQQYTAVVLDSSGADSGLAPVWATTGGIGTISASGLFTAGNSTASGQVVAMLGTAVAVVPVHVRPLPSLAGTLLYTDTNSGQSDICIVPVDQGTPVPLLVTPGVHETFPLWSPDGSRAAFLRTTDLATDDLWVMDADGSAITSITNSLDVVKNQCWAPDGLSLVLSVHQGEAMVLARARIDGQVDVLTSGHEDLDPDWSPDGQLIAFVRSPIWDGTTGQLPSSRACLVSRDGGAVSVLSPDSERAYEPRWSPDGASIAFVRASSDGTVGHLCLMAPDGSAVTDLMPDSPPLTTAGEPRWSPDGKVIAFVLQ